MLALSLIIASLLRYIAMYKQHEISPMYILLIVSGSILSSLLSWVAYITIIILIAMKIEKLQWDR